MFDEFYNLQLFLRMIFITHFTQAAFCSSTVGGGEWLAFCTFHVHVQCCLPAVAPILLGYGSNISNKTDAIK